MYHFYKFNFEYIINSRFGFVSNFLYRGDVVPDKKLDFKIFLGSFLSFLRCRKHSAAVKNTQRPINCWPRGRRFYRGKGIVKKKTTNNITWFSNYIIFEFEKLIAELSNTKPIMWRFDFKGSAKRKSRSFFEKSQR